MLGGGAYADGYHGWKGRIDDVRIYDRALTEFEIGNVMGGADVYVPLTSLANLYDEELVNNKIINFTIENIVSAIDIQSTVKSSGGIGLENVKRRLQLIYPDKQARILIIKYKY